MGRLGEPYVEATTLNYLEEYYSSKHAISEIFASSQAYTISKYNGRADGFLCFHSEKQKFHSVSVEAKSHKTLINLKPYFEIDKFIIHVLLFSLTIGILPTLYFSDLKWFWVILLYLLFSLGIFLLMAFLLDTTQPYFYKKVDVVNQVSRYPANEKWIAISSDSVNLLKERKPYIRGCSYKNLQQICSRKGIGLVVVNHLDAKILMYPKFQKGEYLGCYKFSNEVEGIIAKN